MLTPYLEKTNLTLGIIRDCTVCLMEMLFLKGTLNLCLFLVEYLIVPPLELK